MVEPIASSVLSTLIPRHVAFKQSTSSLTRSTLQSRPSYLSANFFTPILRYDKGKARAVDEPAGHEILGCQSWAQPVSKKEVWNQGGAMRAALRRELDEPQTARRTRRTSQTSRRRFHQPLSHSISQHTQSSQQQVSYSTGNATQPKEPDVTKTAAFIPEIFSQTESEKAQQSPLEQFLAHLNYQAQYQHNLQALDEAFQKANNEDAFSSLTEDEAEDILLRLADQIDTLCVNHVSSTVLHKWGLQMSTIYKALSPESISTIKKSGRWDLIMYRMLAYNASFQSALESYHEYIQQFPNSTEALDVMDSILLSLARHKGLLHTLHYWYREGFQTRYPEFPMFNEMVASDPTLSLALDELCRSDNQTRRRAIMAFCVQTAILHNNNDQSLMVIERMRGVGITPYFEYPLLLSRSLAREGRLEEAKKLFDSVTPTSHQLYSQIKLYLAGRSGDTEGAFKALEERTTAGQFTIEDRANILASLSRSGKYTEMKEYFEACYPKGSDGKRVPHPPIKQYSTCLLAHARTGNVEDVNWWLRDMDSQGAKPTIEFFTNLMALFKKIGDDRSMLSTYKHMLQTNIRPDTRLYTTMISHFANRRDSKAADAVFMDAIKQGVVPDDKMTNALMFAHIQSGSWKEAFRIFQHLTTRLGDVKPSIDVYNTMFKAHLLLGAPFKVMTSLFLKIKQMGMSPDSFTYAILTASACDAGHLGLGLGIIEEIKEQQKLQGRSDLLNVQIMTIVMGAHLRKFDKAKAKELLDQMIAMGMQPTDVTYATIVRAFGRSRFTEDMAQAESFVKEILANKDELKHLEVSKSRKQPIANLYVPLMLGSSAQGDIPESERLYEEFLKAGGRPTIGVYHKLLLTYRNAQELQKALDLWPMVEELADRDTFLSTDREDDPEDESMTHLANIQAPLSVYMDILSKFGMHDEVARIWFGFQKRNFEFDAQNWNHLVVVLIRAGQIERAFEVMEKVLLPNEYMNSRNKIIADEARRRTNTKHNKSDLLETLHAVPQGPPLASSWSRVRVHGTAKGSKAKAIDLNQIDKDFAYPARVLEFIRPSWNDWRPHNVVWRTLLVVWLQLQQNFIPKPLEPDDAIRHNVRVQDISDRDAEGAQAMLESLKKSYPQTVERIVVFLDTEQERLGGIHFERLYVRRT